MSDDKNIDTFREESTGMTLTEATEAMFTAMQWCIDHHPLDLRDAIRVTDSAAKKIWEHNNPDTAKKKEEAKQVVLFSIAGKLVRIKFPAQDRNGVMSSLLRTGKDQSHALGPIVAMCLDTDWEYEVLREGDDNKKPYTRMHKD